MLYLRIKDASGRFYWVDEFTDQIHFETDDFFKNLLPFFIGFNRPQEAQRYINSNFERIDDSISVLSIENVIEAALFDPETGDFQPLKLPKI
jgi:hypothetical protein